MGGGDSFLEVEEAVWWGFTREYHRFWYIL
jgi:hypothetical protein